MNFEEVYQLYINDKNEASITKIDKEFYNVFEKMMNTPTLQYCGKISKAEIEPEIYSYNNNIYFSYKKNRLEEFASKYIKLNS